MSSLAAQSLSTASYAGQCQIDESDRRIYIDYDKDELLSEAGKAIIKDRYLIAGEISPQQAFARVACAFSDDSAHAQRLYDYASERWFMFATPVLANGGTNRGLPISCFVGLIGDSMESIADHFAENMFLAVRGGGIGLDMSKLRSNGTKTSKGNYSPGIIPFCRVVDSQVLASIQGGTRRGAAALYLNVSHPEIEEFVEIRKPTGDQSRRCHNIHNAVTIPDKFMRAVEKGETWDLVDPHTKEIKKSVDARSLWMKILTMRVSTGEPYLFFKDTANRALPQHLKEKGLEINSSQLCNEIMLPTNQDRTAVCCLSSVNLELYDQWKDNKRFIEDLLRMLDNVLDVFIKNADQHMWRAVESAKRERSVGLGAMGFHLYLQQKGVPFESVMSKVWNEKIFKHIKEKCVEANYKLGSERGEAPDAKGTGLRFSHTNTLAPNANISLLCGNVSPSIEPFSANAFTQKTLSGVFLIKNKVLDKTLKNKYGLKGEALEKVWTDITVNNGSVQHLDFMDRHDKDVFKTAMELNQEWIIDHAATRQPYIDQGQSVNLFIDPKTSKAYLHKLHKSAWEKGLKGLYYCRSLSVGKADIISQNLDGNCLSCEG